MGSPGTHPTPQPTPLPGRMPPPPTSGEVEQEMEAHFADERSMRAPHAVHDGPPMNQPVFVLSIIGAIGLAAIAGAFFVTLAVQQQPEASPAAVSVATPAVETTAAPAAPPGEAQPGASAQSAEPEATTPAMPAPQPPPG
jgi:hypothetical protein